MFKPLPSLPESRMYFQKLFDPIQTHGLYGIYKEEVERYKEWLKSFGAKRLRVVKCNNCKGNPYAIICFKWVKE